MSQFYSDTDPSRSSSSGDANSFADLYNYAVRLLARREYARQELQTKLNNRSESSATVEAVLDKLAEQNYLNDARFAEAYIRYRSARGFGSERIRKELIDRGIDAALIPEALADAENSSVDWQHNIEQVWRKKFRQPPADYSEKARQMRFLMYRGFSRGQINGLFLRMQSDFDGNDFE